MEYLVAACQWCHPWQNGLAESRPQRQEDLSQVGSDAERTVRHELVPEPGCEQKQHHGQQIGGRARRPASNANQKDVRPVPVVAE